MPELIYNAWQVLFALLAFLVAFGVLVTVHEFGHFVVARLCGVKVLRFSIGMGKALWKRNFGKDAVEFVIAAVPLGGYVVMLDERMGEKIPPALQHRALNRRPVWQRVLVALAGPLANLLLAVLLFWLAYMVGIFGVRPIIGEVLPGSPAAMAGLRSGMQIQTVEGRPAPTWKVVLLRMMESYETGGRIRVGTVDPDYEEEFVLEVGDLQTGRMVEEGILRGLGLSQERPQSQLPSRIGEITPGGPAAAAGLRPGDLVTAVDGEPIGSWLELSETLSGATNRALSLDILRDTQTLRFQMVPVSHVEADGSQRGVIGVRPDQESQRQWVYRHQVLERYPPWQALQRGLEESVLSTLLTGRFLGWLFSGEVPARHLSGPVGIARISGLSARRGLGYYLFFLALFSINLGLLNLLPIPPLDGAHVLCAVLEGLRRGRPLPERFLYATWIVGWGLMLGLLLFVSYNDLLNLGLF